MTEAKQQPASSAPGKRRAAKGAVMPIGGAEDKSGQDQDDILTCFVELAGSDQARIVVIPTASEEPKKTARGYIDAFTRLGARQVDVLEIRKRHDANAEPALKTLRDATGIFITGGAQARLVERLMGTLVMECIRQRNIEGVVVAGTSAGASILSSHMVLGGTGIGGNSSESAAKKHMVDMAAGFGLLDDIIIDQHFSERGRMGRLLSVYAANPGLLGVGLDEDTAVVMNGGAKLEVIGSGMVTIVDGRDARSDYFEREPGEVLTVADSHLSVLGPGRLFDLESRRAILD